MTSAVNRLVPTRAPQLSLAPQAYQQRDQDARSNILRLYFNTIDSVFFNLLDGNGAGGKFLLFPYAAACRTTDQIFTANTATRVTLDTNEFMNGCTNTGANGIHVEQPGVYNYQFSAQLVNTDTQIHTAWIWLRVNGVDVLRTGSKFDVPSSHGGTDGYLIGTCNFYVELQANDYVELWAAVNQAYVPATSNGIYLEAYAAQTVPFPAPAIPSLVATLSFVSNLPS